VKGADSSAVDKTRATIRDLHTQIKVSIHSIESISERIETLRDQELLPQLLELVQGYAKTSFLFPENICFSLTDNGILQISSDVESDGRVSPDTEANIGRSQTITCNHTF
jgi:hypothetical protein